MALWARGMYLVDEESLAERLLARSYLKCFLSVVVVELVVILELESMSISTSKGSMEVDYLLCKLKPFFAHPLPGHVGRILDLEERRML